MAHTLTLPLSLELLVTVLNIIRALQRTRDLYKSVQSFSDFVFGPNTRDKLYVHVFPVIPIEQCPCCLNYKTKNYITVQDVYDINAKML